MSLGNNAVVIIIRAGNKNDWKLLIGKEGTGMTLRQRAEIL